MSVLLKFRALSTADRRLVTEAFGLLLFIRFGLRLVSFTTVRLCLDRCVSRQGDQIARVAWAAGAAARRLPGTKCLAEALAVHTMLRRRGYAPVFRLGVRHHVDGGARPLDAHAWVECDGAVVSGSVADLPKYAVLSS